MLTSFKDILIFIFVYCWQLHKNISSEEKISLILRFEKNPVNRKYIKFKSIRYVLKMLIINLFINIALFYFDLSFTLKKYINKEKKLKYMPDETH